MSGTEWIIAVSALITAIATAVLAYLTYQYARSTNEIVMLQKEPQIFLVTGPYGFLGLLNASSGAIFIRNCDIYAPVNTGYVSSSAILIVPMEITSHQMPISTIPIIKKMYLLSNEIASVHYPPATSAPIGLAVPFSSGIKLEIEFSYALTGGRIYRRRLEIQAPS
jgi:hypothetical protein